MSQDAFDRRVRMRAALGYSRMETDAELLERLRVKLGLVNAPRSQIGETVDQLAARWGLERRIVEDAS